MTTQGFSLIAPSRRDESYLNMPKESPTDQEVSQGCRPKLGVVKCACNHNTHKAEAGRS